MHCKLEGVLYRFKQIQGLLAQLRFIPVPDQYGMCTAHAAAKVASLDCVSTHSCCDKQQRNGVAGCHAVNGKHSRLKSQRRPGGSDMQIRY